MSLAGAVLVAAGIAVVGKVVVGKAVGRGEVEDIHGGLERGYVGACVAGPLGAVKSLGWGHLG